jgi:hypothetical protein
MLQLFMTSFLFRTLMQGPNRILIQKPKGSATCEIQELLLSLPLCLCLAPLQLLLPSLILLSSC